MKVDETLSRIPGFFDEDEDPERCLYETLKGDRCRKDINSDDAKHARNKRNQITECMRRTSIIDLTDLLKEYITYRCCNSGNARHGDRIDADNVLTPLAARWQKQIWMKLGFTETEIHVSGVVDCSTIRQDEPRFRPHIKRPATDDTVAHKLIEAFGWDDWKTGSIYVFARDDDPGFYKIGVTRRGTRIRLKEWSKCGYTPRLVYEETSVPNAQRCETMIHFELLEYWRSERPCVPCGGKRHQEWFETTEAIVKSVVQQWATFFRKQRPYDADGIQSKWADVAQSCISNAGWVMTAERLLKYAAHERELARKSRLEHHVNTATPDFASSHGPRSIAPSGDQDAKDQRDEACADAAAILSPQNSDDSTTALAETGLKSEPSSQAATSLPPVANAEAKDDKANRLSIAELVFGPQPCPPTQLEARSCPDANEEVEDRQTKVEERSARPEDIPLPPSPLLRPSPHKTRIEENPRRDLVGDISNDLIRLYRAEKNSISTERW